MKRKLCRASAQRGAGRVEGTGGEPVHNPTLTHAALSPRAKAHAPVPIQLLSHACRGWGGQCACAAAYCPPFTEKFGLWWTCAREQRLADRLVSPPPPPRLGLVRRRICTQIIFKRQHSLGERTPPPIGPNAHARPRANDASFLFCACATVIPHSRLPRPQTGREGRELRKGGKGGWRGRGERLLTPWLRKGEAAAASAEGKKAIEKSASAVSAETGRHTVGSRLQSHSQGCAGGDGVSVT